MTAWTNVTVFTLSIKNVPSGQRMSLKENVPGAIIVWWLIILMRSMRGAHITAMVLGRTTGKSRNLHFETNLDFLQKFLAKSDISCVVKGIQTLGKLINPFWQLHVPMQWKIAHPITVSKTMWKTPLKTDFINSATQVLMLWSPLTTGDHLHMVWNTFAVLPPMKKATTVLHTVGHKQSHFRVQKEKVSHKREAKNWNDYNKFLTNTYCL